MLPDLKTQLEKVAQYKPKKVRGRRYMVRAAVTMILRETQRHPDDLHDDGIEVLMMRRAERKGDPWSGHMSFPGGKMDSKDDNSFEASLRELAEETGIPRPDDALRSVGRLSDVLTRNHSGRKPMVVTPFVFELMEEVEFSPNHEVAELVWIPLGFLGNPAHREVMHWDFRGTRINLPCYYYQGRRIWGLSLTMLDEMVLLFYRQRFKDTHSRLQFSPRSNWLLRSLAKLNR
ncbi:MAG: CoA pyrophosphatase [Pseudomonadales bacterium]